MFFDFLFVLLLCSFGSTPASASHPFRPNIILILADDMGYQDVGFRGSDILTPNLDRLANEGVILENHYVMPQCSPTRSSLMSGRHAIRNGFWYGNIKPFEQWGLRLNETTMPEMLKRNGYATHAVGKWHCGYYSWQHTPAQRGFDSFLGGFLGAQKYFNHKRGDYWDFREDFYDENLNFVEKLRKDLDGLYNTDIFTDRAVSLISSHDKSQPLFIYLSYTAPHHPFQVPKDDFKKYTSNMAGSSKNRKTYAAMISVMDSGIGKVVEALDNTGMRDNTLLVFISDNGAVMDWPGSNYPLRGGKHSTQEGGVNTLALVNSPLLNKTGYTNSDLFHVTDWYKTFQTLARDEPAEADKVQLPLDGLNIWNSIAYNRRLGRDNVLINLRLPSKIHNDVPEPTGASEASQFVNTRQHSPELLLGDESDFGLGSFLQVDIDEAELKDFYVMRHKNWKFYSGTYIHQGWMSKNAGNGMEGPGPSNAGYGIKLYNLSTDRSERINVADQNPEVVQHIMELKQGYVDKMTWIGYRKKFSYPSVDGVWMPWVEEL